MSLACLACYGVESSPEALRSYSSRSDTEVSCCWGKRSPPPPPPDPAMVAIARVAPVPPRSSEVPQTPRLTRCHAVRRDLFNNWNFEELMENGRQLCINLSSRSC